MVTLSTAEYLVLMVCVFFSGVICGCCKLADKYHLWPVENEEDEEE